MPAALQRGSPSSLRPPAICSPMVNEVNFWVFRMGNTIVSAHTSALPTDQQWDDYIMVGQGMTDEIGFTNLRGIVFTDGGAPTSAQRERANKFLQGRSARTAIVTSSPIVRGIVRALGWFNPEIRTFAPSRVRDALVHIDFAASEIPKLCDQLRPLASCVEAVHRALEDLDPATGRASS